MLNFVNVFSLFCYYLLLEKSVVLHLNKLESSLPKDAFVTVMFNFEIDPVFWRG